jgi:hypothetical protein
LLEIILRKNGLYYGVVYFHFYLFSNNLIARLPLWSSGGQSSWLQIQKSRVRFPALKDFPRSSASGTGSTQPREYNWATWKKSSGCGLEIREYGRGDSLCWPRGTLYPQTLALTSQTRAGRSVGIVRSRSQATESFFISIIIVVDNPRTCSYSSRLVFNTACFAKLPSEDHKNYIYRQ